MQSLKTLSKTKTKLNNITALSSGFFFLHSFGSLVITWVNTFLVVTSIKELASSTQIFLGRFFTSKECPFHLQVKRIYEDSNDFFCKVLSYFVILLHCL